MRVRLFPRTMRALPERYAVLVSRPIFHSCPRTERGVLQIVKPNSGGAPPFRAVRRPRSAAAADVLLYTYKWRTFIPGMNPELAKMLSSMERARA